MRLALFQPDIPQNCGALLRLGACLGVSVDIVEPCGFPLDDRRMRRAGMDYIDRVDWRRHRSWEAFREAVPARLVLLTSQGPRPYTEFRFATGDCLLVGRESAGAPAFVHEAAAARLRIPMREGLRTLNVALSAAMVLGEALRQTAGFPDSAAP